MQVRRNYRWVTKNREFLRWVFGQGNFPEKSFQIPLLTVAWETYLWHRKGMEGKGWSKLVLMCPTSHLIENERIASRFDLCCEIERGCTVPLISFHLSFLRPYYYLSLLSAIQYLWWWFEEFGIGSTNNPLIDSSLYSRHFSVWYCLDIVSRNSVLVTHAS